MEPLDLSKAPPRGAREKALGLVFLPRTIDKMRAHLPGGNPNGYIIDYDRGYSAYLLRRVGVDQAALMDVVARAADEAEVLAWFAERANLSDVEGINAKFESFTIDRVTGDDLALVHRLHPGLDERPDLTKFLDIFDYDDARVAAGGASPRAV